LKTGVLFNYLAELIAPWFAFYPRVARRIAGVIIVLFQFTLILSGNLSLLKLADHRSGARLFRCGFWAKRAAARTYESRNRIRRRRATQPSDATRRVDGRGDCRCLECSTGGQQWFHRVRS